MNLGYQTWATDPHAPISDEEWRYTYNRWCDAMGIEPRQEIRQNNPCQGMTMEEFLSSNIEHFIPLDEMTRAYAKHYGVESIDLDAIKQQVNTDMEIDLDDSPDFGH